MNFSIYFLELKTEEVAENLQLGEIRINDYCESFQASLSYWNQSDYMQHWKEALLRICNGEDKSALITSMYDPTSASFISWWPLYLEQDVIYIQNQLLFLEQLDKPFFESKLYDYVDSREIFDEDFQKISEWHVHISDIELCLNMLFDNN